MITFKTLARLRAGLEYIERSMAEKGIPFGVKPDTITLEGGAMVVLMTDGSKFRVTLGINKIE
jgi:hypothetical protein